MRRNPILPLFGVLLGALALLGAPAAAESFIIELSNGNTFVTKQRPERSAFDDDWIEFHTDAGNRIAIPESLVVSIASDLENRGFGTVIDTTTVLIGLSANDAEALDAPLIDGRFDPSAFLGGALGGLFGGGGFDEAFGGGFGDEALGPVSNPLFAEPNASGGLPLGLIGVPTGGSSGGGAAIGEPATQN